MNTVIVAAAGAAALAVILAYAFVGGAPEDSTPRVSSGSGMTAPVSSTGSNATP